MFGVVPKPLWERRIPADDRNRIPLAMRCLLVETPMPGPHRQRRGQQGVAKFVDIYGIENAPEPARSDAPGGRARAGRLRARRRRRDHRHASPLRPRRRQHARGSGRRSPSWRSRARGTWCSGASSSSRTCATSGSRRATCRTTSMPVMEAGRLELVDGDVEIVPGIRVMRTPGHTPHHQSVLITSAARRPASSRTSSRPPRTCRCPGSWATTWSRWSRWRASGRCWSGPARGDWLLVFEHDPTVPWGRLDPAEKRPVPWTNPAHRSRTPGRIGPPGRTGPGIIPACGLLGGGAVAGAPWRPLNREGGVII
jgi:hypothetical protein